MIRPRRLVLSKRAPGQSLLLHDFLRGRYANFELDDIRSHVCEFACDRDGSKFIQLKLGDAPDQHKLLVFDEMLQDLRTFMTDRFANFVVQKFIEFGSAEQRQTIFRIIQFDLVALSRHKYGCRVVQRAIEIAANYNREPEILEQLYGPNIVRLAEDAHGNHVIQTCFRSLLDPVQTNLYIHIHARVIDLSYHLHGCRVIQSILEHGTDLLRINICHQIRKEPLTVIQDRCGNYVVQSAIQFCPPDIRSELIDFVLQDVIFLSGHKFSSNVVEKCIGMATPLQKEQTMDLICSNPARWLKRFCTDKFANYVVQKLIDVASPEQLRTLRGKIEPYFNEMERHVCGRKIINCLTERMQALDEAVLVHFNQFFNE